MLIAVARSQLGEGDETLALVLRVTNTFVAAITFSTLSLGVLWRARSTTPGYLIFGFFAVYFLIDAGTDFYDLQMAWFANALVQAYAAYALWNRKPVRNHADTALVFILLVWIVIFALVAFPVQDSPAVYDPDYPAKLFGSMAGLVGGIMIFLLASYMIDANQALKHQASTDQLTGLYNRRYFLEHGSRARSMAIRQQEPLALAMCDIDNFKNINDTFGHDIGDQVIIAFAKLLRAATRETDIVARFGGEEFIVLFPNTDIRTTFDIVERIRSLSAKEVINTSGHAVQFTASFGLTECVEGSELSDCIKAADSALYEAKHSGKNRIVCGEAGVGKSN